MTNDSSEIPRQDKGNRHRGGGGAAVVLMAAVILPSLYVLSIGPACALVERYNMAEEVFEVVYFPLIWLADRWSWLADVGEWYIDLFL